MRKVLAVARDEDFAVLFEYDNEQTKLFIIVLTEGKIEEHEREEALDDAISLIKKYEKYGWGVVWAYGLGKLNQ
jgi:hypothetical protein